MEIITANLVDYIVLKTNVIILIFTLTLPLGVVAKCRFTDDVDINKLDFSGANNSIIIKMKSNNFTLNDAITSLYDSFTFYFWKNSAGYHFTLLSPKNSGYKREMLMSKNIICDEFELKNLFNRNKYPLRTNNTMLRITLIKNPYEESFLDRSKSMLACKDDYSGLVKKLIRMAIENHITIEVKDCVNYRELVTLHFK